MHYLAALVSSKEPHLLDFTHDLRRCKQVHLFFHYVLVNASFLSRSCRCLHAPYEGLLLCFTHHICRCSHILSHARAHTHARARAHTLSAFPVSVSRTHHLHRCKQVLKPVPSHVCAHTHTHPQEHSQSISLSGMHARKHVDALRRAEEEGTS